VRMTREFAEDLLRVHLGLAVRICPEQETKAPPRAVLEATPVDTFKEGQQRDAAYGGGVLVWAQGVRSLRVRFLRESVAGGLTHEQGAEWLTPPRSFEHQPRTDGRTVAAYRQGGGIVVYNLETRSRHVISQTGGPGAVEGPLVAAQGIGIPDGLGGGVWLVPVLGGEPEQLSAAGDSPRLSGGRVVWQETRGEQSVLVERPADGGIPEVIVSDGMHPSLHEGFLAWTTRRGRGAIRVRALSTGDEVEASPSGVFPDIRYERVAFLEQRGERYDLRVVNWRTQATLLAVSDVGFPVGHGPVLTDAEVIWESSAGPREQQLLRRPLPRG
jgi:hypothetical protein